MALKFCTCCGVAFEPRPQVPLQTYCSSPDCQRMRRQRWHRDKLQNDPDYRDNQNRAQHAWLDRQPDYWRQYREKNTAYAERNRSRQRSKPASPRSTDLAKMYASIGPRVLQAGVYRITSVQLPGRNKTDAWTVEITPVCFDCPCKRDACKDRT